MKKVFCSNPEELRTFLRQYKGRARPMLFINKGFAKWLCTDCGKKFVKELPRLDFTYLIEPYHRGIEVLI